MRYLLLLITLVVVLLNGCAKIVVVNVPKEKPRAEGVFYALPKTVIRANLVVEKVEKKAAPFAKFAEIFAPDGELICKAVQCTEEETKSYRVKRGAMLATFGEPDPEHVYMVKFIGRGQLDQSVTMRWNEAGVITGADAKVTNRTSDIALAGVKLAAGLGTRFAFGATDASTGAPAKPCPENPTANDNWVISVLEKHSTTAPALVANYCAIAQEKRASWKKEDDEKQLERATKAYEEIFTLSKLRLGALGQEARFEPLALVQQLDALIAEKLQVLYLGTQTITPWEGAFEVRDLVAGTLPKPTILLRLDKTKGFCAEALLAPGVRPIPERDLIKGDTCTQAREVRLALNFHPALEAQLFEIVKSQAVLNETGERSFRYRIPAQVKAEITDGPSIYGTGLLAIAQLGAIASLPAKRSSKTLAYDLVFVEATGALKSFTLGTSGGLDSGLIDQSSSVGNNIVDARNKARTAEETAERAAADELLILKRRHDILDLRDKICKLQKQNGLSCEVQQ